MKDRVVLVTGANGGLGVHVTQAFLNAGATVVGSSRKIAQSEFQAENFRAISSDISNLQAARNLVDGVIAIFGRLDVLVHTVGGFAGGQSVAETDDASFERMLELN